MAIPTERAIRMPLLEVIEAAGGQLKARDAVDRLAGELGLTQADLRSTTDTGSLRFQNRVMWARLKLVHAGCLLREPRGVLNKQHVDRT